ncbi:hypothetical protein B0J17DRAFT_707785 [Rhizoctonia solani]|nr:hypothetical protein B0J17DRAFT_707785 [Rhizoctonia solani]
MSSNQAIQACSTCGIEYLSHSTINACPMCSLTAVPLGISTLTPTTPVINVEQVQGIYIPARSSHPEVLTVNINMHYGNGRTPRVPEIDFLGPRHTLFYITIMKGPAGQSLSSPYHVYFQTVHRNLPNQCVSAISQGSPKYEWFGDIFVLKFDGTRMERFKNATLADDISNIAWFFMRQTIPSQEARV